MKNKKWFIVQDAYTKAYYKSDYRGAKFAALSTSVDGIAAQFERAGIFERSEFFNTVCACCNYVDVECFLMKDRGLPVDYVLYRGKVYKRSQFRREYPERSKSLAAVEHG